MVGVEWNRRKVSKLLRKVIRHEMYSEPRETGGLEAEELACVKVLGRRAVGRLLGNKASSIKLKLGYRGDEWH